jgi:hypothetical protein
MTTTIGPSGQGSSGHSAKIYQFPTGGRASVNRQRPDTSRLSPDYSSRAYVAPAGSGWYHEEAIRDSQQKNAVVVPITFPHH